MDIDSLESIQMKSDKFVPSIKNLSYGDRLKKLNLLSFERRRVRGDLIRAFKWNKGINEVDISKLPEFGIQHRTGNNGGKLDRFRKRNGHGWSLVW